MLSFVIALGLSAAAHAGVDSPRVPESWYSLPEDSLVTSGLQNEAPEAPKSEKQQREIDQFVEHILSANGEAVERSGELSEPASSDPTHPKDWTPWHAEFFLTDLALSAQGLLGMLTTKGTPSLQVIWRRQNEHAPKSDAASHLLATEPGGIAVTSQTTPRELSTQLEPAIRAILADGKVRDESALRRNLLAAAENFQTVAAALENDPGYGWWVSRFRLDVTIDVSGTVSPVAFAGAETKFRFDWFRLAQTAPRAVLSRPLSVRDTTTRASLAEFVSGVAADLETVTLPKTPTGFQVYQFRVGVGTSGSGTIGIVKGTGSVLGQLYFSQNMPKPKVKPPGEGPKTLAIIESAPSRRHLDFAAANAITMESGPEDVVYRIGREKFRHGLERAMKMTSFFAQRAAKATTRRWKIWEMRPAFDLSVTGSVGLATVGGLASVEIDIYNESF